MSYNFQPYAQDQMYLMPPSITEWVSEASLARFTSEVLDEMDRESALAAFYHQYREDGWGSAAYHLVMMSRSWYTGTAWGSQALGGWPRRLRASSRFATSRPLSSRIFGQLLTSGACTFTLWRRCLCTY